MSIRFLHQKPKPGKTDAFSQFTSVGTWWNDNKRPRSKKAYSTNWTKPEEEEMNREIEQLENARLDKVRRINASNSLGLALAFFHPAKMEPKVVASRIARMVDPRLTKLPITIERMEAALAVLTEVAKQWRKSI